MDKIAETSPERHLLLGLDPEEIQNAFLRWPNPLVDFVMDALPIERPEPDAGEVERLFSDLCACWESLPARWRLRRCGAPSPPHRRMRPCSSASGTAVSVGWALLGLGYLNSVRGELSEAARLLEGAVGQCRDWNIALLAPSVMASLGHV
jgi:hypothetical protein